MNCPLKLNADGHYECPHCHWVYKRKADKPPHRNCPNSPPLDSPEHRETIKQRMLAELRPRIENSDVPQCDLATITAQLDQCLTPCKQFNGQTCTERGSACKKWIRWKEFLACTSVSCRKFDPSPEQPIRPA